MKKRWRPERAPDPKQQAAYDVVISGDPEGIVERMLPLSDKELLGRLEEVRPEIAHALNVRAERRFGPAYAVEVQGGRIGGSVHVSVLLAVRYTVRTGADFVDQLRRFAGEIELEVARGLGEARSGVQVVAKLDEASCPASDASSEDATSWDRIAPILGAVATGVGVLGLVTFVGGAIDWARFQATGLPQEQAVAVVPTQDLVVVGARTLVPAILWGLLACAIYAVMSVLVGSRSQRVDDSNLAAYAEEHGSATRAIFLAVMVLLFEIGVFFITLDKLGTAQAIAFLPLALLLAGLTYAVAKATARFVYLAFTVFLALSVFLGGIAYARALDTPELRAAAVVRQNQKAIVGFFVAENSSRVYLARLDADGLKEEEIERSSARLIGIDKEEISSMEVGAPAAPAAALAQADNLAEELCELELPRALDPKVDEGDQNCWTRPPGVYMEVPPPGE